MLGGKFARAGTLARKALALNPSQSVAKSVMDQVRTKASDWLKQARDVLSSKPAKAKKLLTQVLSAYPKHNPRYREAYGLLKRIDSEDDD